MFIFINALFNTFPIQADRQRSYNKDRENTLTLLTFIDNISNEARIKSIKSKGATKGTRIILYTRKDSGRNTQKP